jgi:hypothetical protein
MGLSVLPMKFPLRAACLIALPLAAAGETAVTPRVDAVELFKNGVAVVRASFEVPQAGRYVWDEMPRAVHGSFWVESDGTVGIQSTRRMIEEVASSEAPTGILQQDLAGQTVTVKLKSAAGAQEPVLSGTVWRIPRGVPPRTWEPALADAFGAGRWMGSHPGSARIETPASTGNFLVLESPGGGRQYLDLSSIASVAASGPFAPAPRRVEKPVMLFDVTAVPRDGGRMRISYLARGIAWVPAYRLDLGEPDFLTIRQNAVVRNELLPLEDTELRLVSGFPNIQFAHVDSPLWAGGSLAAFFQQLGQESGAGGPLATQQLVTYNSVAPNAAPSLPDLAEAGSAGDDLHFESIGKRSLAVGDSLSLEVASARSGYQRVVEWVVPDPRDERGRYLGAAAVPRDEDQPWDALQFRNPFPFPMTTAPAMIADGGRFRGQSLSQWVNPGQTTCLRITKALSIRAEYSEIEEEQQRELVWVGGNDYRRTKVKGSLLLHNTRGKEATLSIRSCFSGELIEAAEKPAARLRTEGVTSVNPRRELVWTLKLAPGEERTLGFRYSVLVDH